MIRIGLGHDTHRVGGAGPLILGGVTIDWSNGLIGHSDADVLLHAATDAILGAAGLGDIGEWFPDTSAEYAGADSAELLKRAVAGIEQRGWRVVNADGIVFAEAPKLSKYKSAIESRIAELLHVAADAVNVKAKTGEQVGPIGRGEAISAQVAVLIQRTPRNRKTARRVLRERRPRRRRTGNIRRETPSMTLPEEGAGANPTTLSGDGNCTTHDAEHGR